MIDQPVLPPPPAVPPGHGYTAGAGRPTNGFAVATIVAAVRLPPLAIVFGHIALAQIRRSGGYEDGRGLAVAGAAIGYASLVLLAAFTIAFVTAGPE